MSLSSAHSSISNIIDKASDLHQKVVEPKPEHFDTHKTFLAAVRGVVQVFSINWQPWYAICGVIVTALFTEKVATATKSAEAMLTALWNSISPKHLLVIVPSGIAFAASGYYFISIPILTGVCNVVAGIFAFKVASELVQKNLKVQKVTVTVSDEAD